MPASLADDQRPAPWGFADRRRRCPRRHRLSVTFRSLPIIGPDDRIRRQPNPTGSAQETRLPFSTLAPAPCQTPAAADRMSIRSQVPRVGSARIPATTPSGAADLSALGHRGRRSQTSWRRSCDERQRQTLLARVTRLTRNQPLPGSDLRAGLPQISQPDLIATRKQGKVLCSARPEVFSRESARSAPEQDGGHTEARRLGPLPVFRRFNQGS